jgi:peroxiredoxin
MISARTSRLVLSSAALVFLIVSTPWLAQGRASITPAEGRQLAPGFTAQDATGASFNLSDYKGKVVLLDFWATWCGGCKEEIPWYIEFQTRYKERGLEVIGISMDDNWDPVKPFIEGHKLNYRVAVGGEQLASLYKIHEMPVTLLIDGHGRIADLHVGVVDKQQFDQEIQTLLKENTVAGGTNVQSGAARK